MWVPQGIAGWELYVLKMISKIINFINAIILAFTGLVSPVTTQNNNPTPQTQIPPAEVVQKNIHPIYPNDLWGHQFYTAKIIANNSGDMSSEEKQAIAQLLKRVNFPPKLSEDLVITLVDPTTIKSDDLIKNPTGQTIQLGNALKPEGGDYVHTNNQTHLIFINSLTNNYISILTHELGHRISDELTSEEWDEYYKLRNIPKGTPWNQNWNLSPGEDFAEVYRETYENTAADTKNQLHIKTWFGVLVPNSFIGIMGLSEEYSSPCYKLHEQIKSNINKNQSGNQINSLATTEEQFNQIMKNLEEARKEIEINLKQTEIQRETNEIEISKNPELQKCRLNALKSGYHTQYTNTPYISLLDDPTRNFIKRITERLQ